MENGDRRDGSKVDIVLVGVTIAIIALLVLLVVAKVVALTTFAWLLLIALLVLATIRVLVKRYAKRVR